LKFIIQSVYILHLEQNPQKPKSHYQPLFLQAVNSTSTFFIICYNNIDTFLNLYSEEDIFLASSYLWTS